MATNTIEKLDTKKLVGYSLGAIPAGLYILIFNLKYIELFFGELKLLPVYFIIGQVIYMIINAFNDPLLGNLSDQTNVRRWGSRRIVYIKWGAPIWAFAFLLVWFPWSFDNQLIIFLHYVISICLFDTMFTLIVLTWMALLPEMTTDLDDRNKANFGVGVVGLFTVLPFLLILGEMNPTIEIFRFFMLIIAIISTISLFVVAYLCKERPELQREETFPLGKSIKETLKLKSFLIFICYNFTVQFTSSIGLSYLFVYLLILGENGLLAYFTLGVILGYGSNIICMKLRPRWGMHKIILRFGVLRVIGLLVLLPFVLLTDNVLMIYLTLFVSTIFSGYGLFTVPLMYLSMDEDEVNNNIRREGMFLGINALFTKPASSIGPIVATLLLTFFGYNAVLNVQPASALVGIKLLLFLVPAIAAGIGLIFIYIYPLHGKTLEVMREKLDAIHKERMEKSQLSSV